MSRTALLALASVGLMLLAGCAGTTPRPGTTPGTSGAKPLVVGTTDTITSLDPGDAYEYLSINVLENTMGTLLAYDSASATLVPDLATGLPEISGDGLTYTFHLKPDLKYADGSRLKASDFLWAFERNSGKVGASEGGPAFLIYDSPGVDLANSTAPDDTTLVVKLKQPGVFFQNLVVFPNFAPLPRNIYTKGRFVEPTGPTDNLPVSSGPYQIVEYRQGESLRLAKNPNYKGAHPAKSEEVTIKFFANSASLKTAIERGEVQVAYRTFTPSEWTDLKGRTGSGVRTSDAPSPSPMRYLAFMVNGQYPEFAKKEVRQGLASLLDRDELVRVVFKGTYATAYSLVPKGMLGQKDTFADHYGTKPDTQKAELLLTTAGYTANNKLRVTLWFNSDGHYGDTETDLATVLKTQFEKSSLVQVQLQSKPWTAFRSDTKQGNLGMFLIGWFPDYLDVDDYLSPFFTPGGARSFGTYYNSPVVDTLIKQEQGDATVATRTATVQQIQELVTEDAPMVPLVTGAAQVAYRDNVRGVLLSPSQVFPYWTLEV